MGLEINTRQSKEANMAEHVPAEVRVYRTGDGDLVADGDPRAAFLAYPVGEPVAEADLDAYKALTGGSAPRGKAAAKPADKAAQKPGDK